MTKRYYHMTSHAIMGAPRVTLTLDADEIEASVPPELLHVELGRQATARQPDIKFWEPPVLEHRTGPKDV